MSLLLNSGNSESSSWKRLYRAGSKNSHSPAKNSRTCEGDSQVLRALHGQHEIPNCSRLLCKMSEISCKRSCVTRGRYCMTLWVIG